MLYGTAQKAQRLVPNPDKTTMLPLKDLQVRTSWRYIDSKRLQSSLIVVLRAPPTHEIPSQIDWCDVLEIVFEITR